jgi:hypothetical protein
MLRRLVDLVCKFLKCKHFKTEACNWCKWFEGFEKKKWPEGTDSPSATLESSQMEDPKPMKVFKKIKQRRKKHRRRGDRHGLSLRETRKMGVAK